MVCTANGLSRYDGAHVKVYRHDPDDPHSLSNDAVICIYEDKAGTLWLGTWGGGLNAFERESEQFTHYQHDPADPHTLSNK